MTIIQQLNIKKYPRYIKKYLLISYCYSFLLWIFSFIQVGKENLLINNEIFQWENNNLVLMTSLIASLATLGPLIGYFFVKDQIPNEHKKDLKFNDFNKALWVFTLLIISSSIIASFNGLHFNTEAKSLRIIILGLIYFMCTSATEEFGWRGVCYPYAYKLSKNILQSSLVISIIWGFWHLPIVLIIFHYQGMGLIQMIPGFIIFIGSIFLMSYLHAWVNLRTTSVLPNVLLHGLHNWWPVVLPFFFGNDLNQFAIIGGYITTILILHKFYPSKIYFE